MTERMEPVSTGTWTCLRRVTGEGVGRGTGDMDDKTPVVYGTGGGEENGMNGIEFGQQETPIGQFNFQNKGSVRHRESSTGKI